MSSNQKMANFKIPVFFIYALLLFSLGLWSVAANEDRKEYIVYMGSKSEEYSLTSEDHVGILQQVIQSSNAEESLVRSYGRSFNGFAAKMTEKESEKLKNLEGVVSVFPSKTLHIQTTKSWDFLGLPDSAHTNDTAESDIIVGVIDTGIWPESKSFSDDGFGPAPKKWKGTCDGGQNFTCNNKLIGAKVYSDSGNSARDEVGHGSHTASTAAGRKVDGVSFYGIAGGSARGGVPSARIAAYKVCDLSGCLESNILAAFDDAIADGVDVITISIGPPSATSFDNDVVAVGAFHAMMKGILTFQSAGNEGNVSLSVSSVAPWLVSVAASTISRHIIANVVLGNGKTLTGNSVNSFILKGDEFPLSYGESSSDCPADDAKACDCLEKSLVKGKIVVCDKMSGMDIALQAGALGAVGYTGQGDTSFILPLPAVGLTTPEYDALLSYINSTKDPVVNILKSEAINDTTAPVVASFSSRGPNSIARDILKPDIAAPGVEILAAYSPLASVSENDADKRSVQYSVLSGTSMACPHAAGAAAYLKSIHTDWSPAAIKSALMTTAHPMSPSKNTDAEFAYGSGHLNPVGATNPGLVYDTDQNDYLRFLCNLDYTDDQIRKISGNKSFSCPKKIDTEFTLTDVNYPSLSVRVRDEKPFTVTFQRTVTNIGVANSTYVAKIESDPKMKVTVEPNSLSFKSLKEKNSFNVTVAGGGEKDGTRLSASLVWSDGIHSVRSPIVVYTYRHPL